MTVPNVQYMTLAYSASLGADVTLAVGPFANAITIRKFIENCGADSAGTTALNIDDAGAAGAGTTAIADKTAGTITDGIVGVVTEANNVGAVDGYKLAAGNHVKVAIDWDSTAILGYTLVMEYVDGIG